MRCSWKVTTLALALTLLAVGCGHPVQRQLEGRWHGRTVENFDDERVAAATGWARGASLEFAGPTVTVDIPAEDPRSGRYEVVRAHKGNLLLAVDRGDGSRDQLNLKLDDEDSLRWDLGKGRYIVMKRER